ncbi:hypothetical protein [Streptomyces peucetius]|nr:hypothetical protein CGZ69_05990 [Streptomyces peucetius subsp. caesius ATCC 27952]
MFPCDAWSPGPWSVARSPPRHRLPDTVRARGAEWLEAIGGAELLPRRPRDGHMGLATWCELEGFNSRRAETAGRSPICGRRWRRARATRGKRTWDGIGQAP